MPVSSWDFPIIRIGCLSFYMISAISSSEKMDEYRNKIDIMGGLICWTDDGYAKIG